MRALAALVALAEAVIDGEVALPVGACLTTQLCKFADPEDIADLTGTPWLIVSEAAQNGDAGLAALDTRTGAVVRYAADGLGASCLPGARGGGIGVRAERHGHRLVRILQAGPDGDAVESFRVTVDRTGPHLARVGCVAAPAPYFLNDVAPLPDGGFAATHMFDPAIPREHREATFLAGTPTGYLVRWSTSAGWSRIPGSEGSFPNGIATAPDGRWLAFAQTYGHAIDRIRLDGSGRTRLTLAMQPDNVSALADGRFVVVGGTGQPLVSTRRCPALRRPGCAFPAAAARLDFARGVARTIAIGGGVWTPGFSVGVVKHRHLYLGTAFGDRITVLPLRRKPAITP